MFNNKQLRIMILFKIFISKEDKTLENQTKEKEKDVDTQLSLNFDSDLSPVEGDNKFDRIKELTRSELEEEYKTVIKEKEELLNKINLITNEKNSFANDAKIYFEKYNILKTQYEEKCKELKSIKNNNLEYAKLVEKYNELVAKYNKVDKAINGVCNALNISKRFLLID